MTCATDIPVGLHCGQNFRDKKHRAIISLFCKSASDYRKYRYL